MLSQRILLITMALVMGLARPARADPCTLALNSRIPVDLSQSQPVAALEIEDQPARLIIDTGAWASLLSPAAVKRLGLRPDPDRSHSFRGIQYPWVLNGIGGERLTEWVLAHAVKLGQLTGRRFHFQTTDISFGDADGLLGREFLRDFDIDLNFAGKEIRLYKAVGDCARPKVFLTSPLYTVPLIPPLEEGDDEPTVTVYINGKPLRAIIDTGAMGTALYRNAAARLGLGLEKTQFGNKRATQGVGPNAVPSVRHIFDEVSVGDLTFRHMTVEILNQDDDESDMLLGNDFQNKLHLWISRSAHMLIMQYPPQPSPVPYQGSPN